MRNRAFRPMAECLEKIEAPSFYTVPVPLPNFPVQPVAPQVLPQAPVAPPKNVLPPAPMPFLPPPLFASSPALQAHATQV